MEYRSRFASWDQRATVRQAPRPELGPVSAEPRLYYPPEFVPSAAHPDVLELAPAVAEELSLTHVFMDFDASNEIEHKLIAEVASDLALGRSLPDVPPAMRLDAHRICCDEAYHAVFQYETEQQLAAATGFPPIGAESRFLRHLGATLSNSERGQHQAIRTCYAVISESISINSLVQVRDDVRLVPIIRRASGDHASDEGRHAAFFAQLFEMLWASLDAGEKAAIGTLLPAALLSFFELDLSHLERVLRRAGLSPVRAQAVLEECHSPSRAVLLASSLAQPTITLFERCGVFADGHNREAFREAGII